MSCTNQSDDSTTQKEFEIVSPFEKIDVPFQQFTILNEEGGKIQLPDGGFIDVPANTFANDAGEVIKGEVTIEFRDFKNPAEIIASGIPMSYDSASVSGDFQSAGMYQIQANQKGQNLDVAQGKSIEVGLTSGKSESNYNFYDLKQDGNWNYNFNCKPTENPSYTKTVENIKKSIEIKEPVAPVKADDTTAVFSFKYNQSAFPELAAFDNILWTPYQNRDLFNAVKKLGTEDVEIVKNEILDGVYDLKLTVEGTERTLSAQPVFLGSDYQMALSLFEKKNMAYNAALDEKKAEINRVLADQRFLRTSNISGMGVYNYDRLWHNSEAIFVDATFKVNQMKDYQVQKVYLVSNNNDVIYYQPERFSKLGYIASDHNTLVAILPGDKIAKFNLDNAQFRDKEKVEINLEVMSDTISSTDEVHELLKSI